jgi:2-oxoglutarate ferredoxin oxidoreductase subunit beta
MKTIVDTKSPPTVRAKLIDDFAPSLILPGTHKLCAGCGEPAAIRSVVEMIDELGLTNRSVAVFGIGCYTSFSPGLDVEVLQALHGRAPSLAAGLKRVNPDSIVFTVQGDGDMVNEGLQEVIHTAARGENVTCVMLNNGVFGETGGHMTATTVVGQRTKNSLEGRDPKKHGFPIRMAEMIAPLEGVAYVARGATNNAGSIFQLRKMLRSALDAQVRGLGFSFVEILTMCPTGWFIQTGEAPDYLDDKLASYHKPGVIKDLTGEAAP